MDKRYTVICPNGRQEEFDSRESAYYWADYGHCCLAVKHHSIVAGPVVPAGVAEREGI